MGRMTAHTPRTYEVPEALVAAGYGPTVDLDVLDREVEVPGPFGDWAEKVLFVENTKTLHEVCGDMRLLPRGILASVQLDDESMIVSGLIDADNRIWDKRYNAWVPVEDDSVETVMLEEDEVAYVARALREGADEVWFRPYVPKAFVAAPAPPPVEKTAEPDPTAEEVPPGSAIVAVVDPIDEDAVLEMLAVTPGPRVLRRHNGNWFNDPAWVGVLKSVKPPKIVKLNEAQVASVASQVDRSTVDQEWEPFDADSREQYQIFTASAAAAAFDDDLPELQEEDLETTVESLIAVAGRELTPEDIKNTERLKRYWTVGPGAAKIRWGTPGAWTRCYRNVSKYMTPNVAKGYCTNLSQRLGGPGIATHVGDVKPIPGTALAIERSPYLQEIQNESDERAIFALIAVAGREVTPKDVAATERLKRYWTVGRGAAKIRWGTPGSWRRCYRHLVKYVGPKIAPGYCTNLSMRLGGPGVATHVGKVKPIPGKGLPGSAGIFEDGSAWDIEGHKVVIDPEGIGEEWYSHPDGSIGNPACLASGESTIWVLDPSTGDETWRVCPIHGDSCEDDAMTSSCQWDDCTWTNHYLGYGNHPLEAVTAANPSGVNGYDRGMTFEQSTQGVERDFHGRFAPEGGSNRSERMKRRKKSMARHRKAREEKDSKKGGADKAKKAAQREELANMSLQIAQLRAAGRDIEAAELRVKYAQRAVDFADTPARKANAMAALVNAQTSLVRAREAARPKFKAGRTVRAPAGQT